MESASHLRSERNRKMPTASVATQELIDQRLDTIDRALMGLMLRSERLKFMADLEKMVCDGRDLGSVLAEEVAEAPASPQFTVALAPRGGRGRSRLALSSGVLGIVALVLLFMMPVTYIVVSMVAEGIGEIASYALIASNVLAVAVGGAAAVALGIAALVRLNRRHSRRVGRGWAVTGLCTGPLPMLIGGLALLFVVLPTTGLVVSEYRGAPAGGYYPSDAPPGNMAVPVSHDQTMSDPTWEPSTPAAPTPSRLSTSEEPAEPRPFEPAIPPTDPTPLSDDPTLPATCPPPRSP
jgi:hypothetical protein